MEHRGCCRTFEEALFASEIKLVEKYRLHLLGIQATRLLFWVLMLVTVPSPPSFAPFNRYWKLIGPLYMTHTIYTI